jgi:hypothetical protein
MATFFVPGLTGQMRAAEDAYADMRKGVELDTGHRPRSRRILQLSSRRAGVDCLTEVGRPDPIYGGTVMAIFDLGPHQPYVVHRRAAVQTTDGISDVLGCHVYSVVEFES